MTALVLLALAAGPPAPVAPLPVGAVARLGAGRFLHFGPAAPALSPDGGALATIGVGGILISRATAGPAHLLKCPAKVGMADRVVFCPDGSRLANLGNWPIPGAPYASVAVYDARRGELQLVAPGHDPNYPIAFSRDGGRLAVIEGGFKAAVWGVADKKRLCMVEVFPHALEVVALSPDGQTLATCCNGSSRAGSYAVQLWSARTGKALGTMLAEGEAVKHAVFSPDGKSLATAQANGRLVVWDVATRKPRASAKLSHHEVAEVRFTPDGKKVAVALAGGVVEFHDSQAGKRLGRGKHPAGTRLAGLGFRPDGRAVAVGVCRSRVRVWDVTTGKVLSPNAGHAFPVQALAFRADGWLVSGGADGCRLWRPGTWAEARRAERPPGPEAAGSQRTFLSSDGRYAIWSEESSALLVDTATGRQLGRLGPKDTSPYALYAFSPDGRRLAQVLPAEGVDKGASGKGVLRVWALPGLRGGRKLSVEADTAGTAIREQAAFSPDGSLLALTGCRAANPYLRLRARGGDRGAVLGSGGIFGLADGKKWAEFKIAERGSVAWSPDGRLLCITDSTGQVAVLNPSNGQALRTLPQWAGVQGGACAFSPCGRLLAVAAFNSDKNEGWVSVYETATATRRMELRGHRGEVRCLAFSHDGRWLATGGEDSTILVWALGGDQWARRRGGATWDDLGHEDARRAFGAMAHLAGRPADAVALLRKHLKPVPGKSMDEAAVRAAIKGLGSEDFETRQRSQGALVLEAERLAPLLQKARMEADDLEVRQRLGVVLEKASGWPRPDLAREVRGVELLERVGTPGARKLLRELAGGNLNARLTREARAALARLEERR